MVRRFLAPPEPGSGASDWLSDSNITAALVSALVAILLYWVSQRSTARAARKELQRAAIADWLKALSTWVDRYGYPDAKPDYGYHQLTSRPVVELSLARRDRYLAWWMHEMGVAVIRRRLQARTEWKKSDSTYKDLNVLLRDTGQALVDWHHRKLRSSDFLIPYKLRANAHHANVEVWSYAEKLGLTDFVQPQRMGFKRRVRFFLLLTRPETGIPVMDALDRFAGFWYVAGAMVVIVPVMSFRGVRFGFAAIHLRIAEWKAKRAALRMYERLRAQDEESKRRP